MGQISAGRAVTSWHPGELLKYFRENCLIYLISLCYYGQQLPPGGERLLMKTIKSLALILGTSFLLTALSVSSGNCLNAAGPAPTMGMPPGQAFPAPGPGVPLDHGIPAGAGIPSGPGVPPGVGLPPGAGPMLEPVPLPGIDPMLLSPSPECGPFGRDWKINVEAGGRVFYQLQSLKIRNGIGPDLDFVDSLKFSRGLLLGEAYAALRLPPWFALTYTFRFPREDTGSGTLPASLRVSDTLFLPGDPILIKSTSTAHRWEGEFFLPLGCHFRGGVYVLGDLLIERWDVDSTVLINDVPTPVSVFKTYSEFYPGLGGTAEFAPTPVLFIKGKAAYLFSQENLGGVYLDGEVRFFPDFNKCDMMDPGPFRPYIGAGFRYKFLQWIREDQKFEAQTFGPYGSIGFVF